MYRGWTLKVRGMYRGHTLEVRGMYRGRTLHVSVMYRGKIAVYQMEIILFAEQLKKPFKVFVFFVMHLSVRLCPSVHVHSISDLIKFLPSINLLVSTFRYGQGRIITIYQVGIEIKHTGIGQDRPLHIWGIINIVWFTKQVYIKYSNRKGIIIIVK